MVFAVKIEKNAIIMLKIFRGTSFIGEMKLLRRK
jgi:hypothetical protein